MTENSPFVYEMMQRVVTNDGIKLFLERRFLDVVREKAATELCFVIQVVRNVLQAFASHANEIVANINAGYVVAESREVFTEPTGTTTNVENSCACGQRERDR